MAKLYKEFLTFTKSERNGAFVLISIILCLIIIYFSLNFLNKPTKTDFSEFNKEIEDFKNAQKTDSSSDSTTHYKHNFLTEDDLPIQRNLFKFNPNNLPTEKWKKLGLKEKQIKIIKNFESKGGKFFKKEDLKKIYGISENDYKTLEPFIEIPNNNEKHFDKPISKSGKNKNIIELNSADSSALTGLKGIGASFAKRIIKYRNLLGGFFKKEQLLEVWGLDSAKFLQFSNFVNVDITQIKKININSASFEELRKQPYIGYNTANAIINFKKQHGNYKSIEDLKKIKSIDDKTFDKISHYISIQ